MIEGADHGFSAVICILRPQSRGHLELKSADPSEPPLMYPNYLSEEQDIIDTRNAFRESRRVFMQPAFDDYRGEQSKPSSDVKNAQLRNDLANFFLRPLIHEPHLFHVS